MIVASVTELGTNMSFDAQIDTTPSQTQNFAIVYVDDKEVKRPTSTSSSGLIKFKINKVSPDIDKFLNRWFKTRKRIELMVEAEGSMYFMKGCSMKEFTSSKKQFTVFYNTFKEA